MSMKWRDTRFKCQKCVGKTISGTNRSPKEHGRVPKHELDYRESFREDYTPDFFSWIPQIIPKLENRR